MGSSRDWIPSREEALASLMAIWKTKLSDTSTQSAYGWTAAECTPVTTAITTFTTARTAYQASPTKINADTKTATKKAAVEALRKFARERIRYNTKMTVAQREELGIFPADPVPTPVPVPDKGPDSTAEISADLPGVVKVRYHGAKPYGVDWVDIAWGVLDAPVADAEDLPHVESFSRNPWEHTFVHEDRHRNLHYVSRSA
jgi:hypothetical protein